ncbi:DUF4126 domain-containing protein [Gammaproteobacteria bacterium]
MEDIGTIALTMGASWASGINLYATLLVLGYLHHSGSNILPPDLLIVANPLVMSAAGVMYMVEFFADKIPGVDTVWDTLHTFVRIPAGAALAAGAVGDGGLAAQFAMVLVGGGLASATHATKTGTRVLINTSPEPFTNWTASVTEDAMVVGGLWTALHHPVLFLGLLIVFLVALIWVLPRLWRALLRIFATLGRWLGLTKSSSPPPSKSEL